MEKQLIYMKMVFELEAQWKSGAKLVLPLILSLKLFLKNEIFMISIYTFHILFSLIAVYFFI